MSYHLSYDAKNRLALYCDKLSPIAVDMLEAAKARGSGRQLLLRACKLRPGMMVVDATAGWGRDSALLARTGVSLLMLEKHPIMSKLLLDGIKRFKLQLDERCDVHFMQADACYYLKNLQEKDYPDVIYLDPMHPTRNKSALVKKDMQILQKLLGEYDEASTRTLLECCIQHVKKRVVLKWPLREQALLEPAYSIAGKTVRYDVFTNP